ncbi:MAG: NUDIX hydrolase [Actinomycetota bacterium]
MRTATATSAGGVVFDAGGRVVLLGRAGEDGVLRWSLPKGAIEDGESVEHAAVREVREETGIDAAIVAPAGVIDYWFVWKPEDTRYHKFVHYFSMRATGGDFSRRDAEADDVGWFDRAQALEKCSYPNERGVIEAAAKALDA